MATTPQRSARTKPHAKRPFSPYRAVSERARPSVAPVTVVTASSSGSATTPSGAPLAGKSLATDPHRGRSSCDGTTQTYPNLSRLAWTSVRVLAATLLAWSLVLILARVAEADEPDGYTAAIGTNAVYVTFPNAVAYACTTDGEWRVTIAGIRAEGAPWTVTLMLAYPYGEWYSFDLPLVSRAEPYADYVGGDAATRVSRIGYIFALVPEGWRGHVYISGGPCDGYGQPPSWHRTLNGREWRVY